MPRSRKMLKGRQGHVLIFGLSELNVVHLKAGEPIFADISTMTGVKPSRCLIFYGPTEEIMETKMAEEGLPFAKRREMPHFGRSETERLVDLLEAVGDRQAMAMAAELREVFGMSPYPAGTVRPPNDSNA